MSKTGSARLMLIVLMMAQAVFFQGCVSSTPDMMKAEKLDHEKDFDAAVKYYNKALEKDPDNLSLKIRLKDARQKASVAHMKKAVRLMEEEYFRKAIEELQVSIAFYSGNRKAISLIDKAKRLKEAEYYVRKGTQQVKTGDFKGAKKSFQKALELNPENRQAQIAKERFRKRKENLPKYRLDLKNRQPISLKFKKTPVVNVFEILSKLTGINFIFDKDMKETKVTLFMTDVSFDKFLEVLLKTNSLKAKLINRKTMLIYPDTPAKLKEYEELRVRTFYLSYMDAKNAVSILTKILRNKYITLNENLNAVTIRGSKDEVKMASRIIEANDRSPSEVILNVEILEVKRSKEKDLGLSISDTITFGVSETGTGIDFDNSLGFATMGSFRDVGNITDKELYLSLPKATLKLLKKDGDTRTLAKPQLRVSSSEKAKIHIGERVPFRTNRRVQTDGSTTFDFQYQDVGVKLTAEPVINMYEQISMKLNIEVSALGNNVGTANDPQFSIKTRTAESVLTINDGDSVIIGGLIEDSDRSATQKIPLAGEVPVMGKLFSSTNTEVSKTDILLTITPVVIRQQDVPEKDVSEFWSGTENEIALEEPEEEKIREKTSYNALPDNEYIEVTAENAFLPGNDYYSVQVYSSKDRSDAEKRSGLINEAGYETWIRPAEIEGKGTFYRVFAGQYPSYELAEEARIEMVKQPIFPEDIHIVDRAYVYEKF